MKQFYIKGNLIALLYTRYVFSEIKQKFPSAEQSLMQLSMQCTERQKAHENEIKRQVSSVEKSFEIHTYEGIFKIWKVDTMKKSCMDFKNFVPR